MIDAEEQKLSEASVSDKCISKSVFDNETCINQGVVNLEIQRQIGIDGSLACISSCNDRLEELQRKSKELQLEKDAIDVKKKEFQLEIDKIETKKMEIDSKSRTYESNVSETLDLLKKIEAFLEFIKTAKSVIGLCMAAKDITICKGVMKDLGKVALSPSEIIIKKSDKIELKKNVQKNEKASNTAFGSQSRAITPSVFRVLRPAFGAAPSTLITNFDAQTYQSPLEDVKTLMHRKSFGTTSTSFGAKESTIDTLFGEFSGCGGLGAKADGITGTTVKYTPLTGTDTMTRNGVSYNFKTRLVVISTMKEYENKSLEQLRVEDYIADRKGSGDPSFGHTSTAQPLQTGGIFGSGNLGGNTSWQPKPTDNQLIFGAKTSKSRLSIATPTQSDDKNILSSTEGFSFGLSATNTTSENTNKPFSFTLCPATGSVPAPVPGNTTPKKESGGSGFIYGSPSIYEFSFSGVKAVKSQQSRNVNHCEYVKSEDGDVEKDDGDNVYYKPVVPLPDKVDVVTGEENETILYCHRSKLFRLAPGEWKERGIGDIKLLECKENGKIRLLMRREQVHKVCLNHNFNLEMEFRRKDEKTYYWATMDYSNIEPQNETFAIRFKTLEIAEGFFGAMQMAKKKLRGQVKSTVSDTIVISKTIKPTPKVKSVVKSPKPDSTTPVKFDTSAVIKKLFDSNQPSSNYNATDVNDRFTFQQTEDSEATKSNSTFGSVTSTTAVTHNILFSSGENFSPDKLDSEFVEVVYEKKASAEKVEQARKLQLPDNFFLYEDAPLCPGCRGCNDDLLESKPNITTFSTSSVAEPPAMPVIDAKPAINTFDSDQPSYNFNFTNVNASPIFKQTEEPEVTKSDSAFGNVTSKTAVTHSISFSFGEKLSSGTSNSEYEDAPSYLGSPGCSDTYPTSIGITATSESSVTEPPSTPVIDVKSSFSIFGAAANSTSIFKGISSFTQQTPSTTPGSTPSIFGGLSKHSNKPVVSPSIFGSFTSSATSFPSIFGGISSCTTSSPSLFGGLKPALSVAASTTASPVFRCFGKSDSSSTASTPADVFDGLAEGSSTNFVVGGAGSLFATPQQTSSSAAAIGDTQDFNKTSDSAVGTTGGIVFGVGSSTSSSLSGGNKSNPGQETKDLQDFIKQVSGEMNQWERSGQWLLSSFTPLKTSAPIPGFVDTSPEELRIEAYNANNNNTFATHQSQWNELQNKHKQLRKAYKMSTPEAKETLKAVYNTKASYGAQANPSNVFGGGSVSTSSTTSVFGGSGSDASATTASISVFGAAAKASGPPAVFSGGSVSASSTTSVFGGSGSGASATTASTSVFGAAAKAMGPPAVFGGGSVSASSTTSVFGGSGSGASATTASTSVFGTVAKAPGPLAVFGRAAAFGAAAASSSNSVFGQHNKRTFGAGASKSLFGVSFGSGGFKSEGKSSKNTGGVVSTGTNITDMLDGSKDSAVTTIKNTGSGLFGSLSEGTSSKDAEYGTTTSTTKSSIVSDSSNGWPSFCFGIENLNIDDCNASANNSLSTNGNSNPINEGTSNSPAITLTVNPNTDATLNNSNATDITKENAEDLDGSKEQVFDITSDISQFKTIKSQLTENSHIKLPKHLIITNENLEICLELFSHKTSNPDDIQADLNSFDDLKDKTKLTDLLKTYKEKQVSIKINLPMLLSITDDNIDFYAEIFNYSSSSVKVVNINIKNNLKDSPHFPIIIKAISEKQCEVYLFLQQQWRLHTTETSDEYVTSLSEKCRLTRFKGSVHNISILPSCLHELYLSLGPNVDLTTLPYLHQLKNLKRLDISVSEKTNASSLSTLPIVIPSRMNRCYNVRLYLPRVSDCQEWPIKAAEQIKPAKQIKLKEVTFPDSNLTPIGVEWLVQELVEAKIKIEFVQVDSPKVDGKHYNQLSDFTQEHSAREMYFYPFQNQDASW